MIPGWQPLLDRMAEEKNPATKAHLEIVARHVIEEVAGNTSALMATLVPEPHYTVWGASESTGPSGYAAVVDWYHRLQAAGRNRLDYVIRRVVADERCVVTEGDFQYAIAGRELGVAAAESGEPVDPDSYYLVTHRTTVFWPISPDGLIEGEDLYAGERHRVIRRLGDHEQLHLGPLERQHRAEQSTAHDIGDLT